MHSGTIALSKVRFNANQEWEFVSNFKLLQKAFDAANIKKVQHYGLIEQQDPMPDF